MADCYKISLKFAHISYATKLPCTISPPSERTISSGYSDSTTPLFIEYLGPVLALSPTYNPVLALSPIYSPVPAPYSPNLAPTTRFFISRAPNMVTRLDVELQPLSWLPGLLHYTGSHNSVLHLMNFTLEVDLQPPTLAPYTGSHQRGSSLQGLVTRLVIELHPPTQAPYTASLYRLHASGST